MGPHVVTAPNTNFFIGAVNSTVGTDSTRDVYFEPNLSAPTPPVAKINFTVYDPAASIVARVCPELASVCDASTAVYSSSPQTYSVGPQFVSWNGADTSGKAVAAEAYTYALEATKGPVTQVVDSPVRDGSHDFYPLIAFFPPGMPTSYDGYRNDPWKIRYVRTSANGLFAPGRIFFRVEPRDDSGSMIPGKAFITPPDNWPNGQPLPLAPASNPPYVMWPSRSPSGEILSGDTHIEVAPVALKYYVIIVRGSAPAVTRDTGEVNLTAEPWLVYDTFEQVAAIRYKVDRLSDVSISLLPPDSWDDTGAPTWQFTNVPANTSQLFEFRGHEVLGMVGVSAESSRQLVTALASEGAYTFRVRATDKVSLRTAETVVTVQIRH